MIVFFGFLLRERGVGGEGEEEGRELRLRVLFLARGRGLDELNRC